MAAASRLRRLEHTVTTRISRPRCRTSRVSCVWPPTLLHARNQHQVGLRTWARWWCICCRASMRLNSIFLQAIGRHLPIVAAFPYFDDDQADGLTRETADDLATSTRNSGHPTRCARSGVNHPGADGARSGGRGESGGAPTSAGSGIGSAALANGGALHGRGSVRSTGPRNARRRADTLAQLPGTARGGRLVGPIAARLARPARAPIRP